MRIRVLGPLEVDLGGGPVDLGGHKQRLLLALLVAAGGRTVSVERVVDELWGYDPPAKAMASLQSYVANLRRALEPDRPPRTPASVLVTRAPGYALVPSRGHVDAVTFGRLVGQAHGCLEDDPGGARGLLVEALGLWSGEAYGGLVAPGGYGTGTVAAEAARLEELRLGALEDRWLAEVALGGHAAAVPELEQLLAVHPLRERAWGALAVALYRGQRQGDALEALRRARTHLAEELGIDPGPELRRLEQAVLAQDPTLDLPRQRVPGSATAHLPPAAVSTPPAGAGSGLVGRDAGLVGRDPVLAELDTVLDQAAAGRGRVVLVTGEPGIGKTRLVEELRDRAAARGMRTGWGSWDAEGGAPALWAWTQALDALQDNGSAALATISGDGDGRADVETATFRRADATLALLRSAGAPVLVVLDDLHWADPDSLRLLRRIAGALADVPAVVVGTSREAESEIGEALATTLAVLARVDPVRVHLDGLAATDVAALVRDRHGVDVPRDVARAVHERTDGNPFYVGELVRLMASEGQLADPGAPARLDVPDGVRDVVRRRLALLPDGAEPVLAAAAVVGRSFDLDVVEDAAGVSEDAAYDAVEAALLGGLVDEDPGAPGRYRFEHALVREAVYTRIPAPRRARAHARVADATERLRAGRVAEHLAELAGHYALAGPAHARDAWTFAEHAAARAAGQAAYDEAVRLLESACRVVVDDALATGEERRRLLVTLGRNRIHAVRLPEAWDALAEAARLALADDDVLAAADAVVVMTTGTLWTWREYLDVDAAAIALIEELLDRLPAGHEGRRAQLTGMLAIELFYAFEQSDRSTRLAQESQALARTACTDAELLRVLEMAHLGFSRPDLLERRTAVNDEQLRIARRLGDRTAEARGLARRAADLVEGGRVEEGEAELLRSLQLAEEHRFVPVLIVAGWGRALLLQGHGRLEDAWREVARLDALHSSVSMTGGGIALVQYAGLLALTGRLGELRDQLAAGVDELPPLRDLLALAHLQAGDVSAARGVLGPWEEQAPMPWDYLWLAMASIRGQVWAALGDEQAVRDLREALSPYAGRFAVGGLSVAFRGSVEHTLGLLAAAAGDLPAAAGHLRAALERHEGGGFAPWVAASAWRLSGVLRALGEDDEAAGLAERAEALAAELGLVLDLPVDDASGVARG